MSNPQPNISGLSSFSRFGKAEGKLSEKQIQVRPEQEVYDFLMSLPTKERVSLIRQALREAVQTYQSSSSA
jgi:hypothetical protein